MSDNDLEVRILNAVDRQRLVDMCVRLADTVSLTGEEEPAARLVGDELERLGMEVQYQEVEAGRPNVIGRLRGTGGGNTLMFNAHLDHFDTPEPTLVEGDRVYGRGLVNMKCAFAGYIEAVAALQRAGASLAGDIIVSGVVGEIEKAQIGQYQGAQYRGGGLGATYLMSHGLAADHCIIGEPTGLRLQIGNEGLTLARINVSSAGDDWVEKTFRMAEAIKAWEPEYQRKYPHPFMLPIVRVGALDGGHPFKPGVLPSANLYLHVRTLPGVPTMAIQRDLEQVCAAAAAGDPDLRWSVELYLSTQGYEIPFDSPVAGAVANAHRRVFGRRVEYGEPLRYAITSDGSHMFHHGLPAVTYGAGFGSYLGDPTEPRQEGGGAWNTASGRRRGVGITNLLNCTKVYALAALDLCGQAR